jgi:hypothetical protein
MENGTRLRQGYGGRNITRAEAAFASYHLNPHLAAHFGQRAVSCNEPSIQRFSKCQISGVVGGETVPHFPDAREQDEMWIAREREVGEIGKRLGTPLSGDDRRAHVAAQNLSDFQVDEMRSVKRHVGGEDEAAHVASGRRLEENLKNRGSVDNNQR